MRIIFEVNYNLLKKISLTSETPLLHCQYLFLFKYAFCVKIIKKIIRFWNTKKKFYTHWNLLFGKKESAINILGRSIEIHEIFKESLMWKLSLFNMSYSIWEKSTEVNINNYNHNNSDNKNRKCFPVWSWQMYADTLSTQYLLSGRVAITYFFVVFN